MKIKLLFEQENNSNIPNRFNISEIPLDYQIPEGYREGWRSTSTLGNISPTVGHTATEGDGYYIALNKHFAEGMKQIGWGNQIQRVQLGDSAKLIPVDTLWLLQAWQKGDETIFKPAENNDDYFLKVIKFAMHNVGIDEKSQLVKKIDKLTSEIRNVAMKYGADGIFAKEYGFIVLY